MTTESRPELDEADFGLGPAILDLRDPRRRPEHAQPEDELGMVGHVTRPSLRVPDLHLRQPFQPEQQYAAPPAPAVPEASQPQEGEERIEINRSLADRLYSEGAGRLTQRQTHWSEHVGHEVESADEALAKVDEFEEALLDDLKKIRNTIKTATSSRIGKLTTVNQLAGNAQNLLDEAHDSYTATADQTDAALKHRGILLGRMRGWTNEFTARAGDDDAAQEALQHINDRIAEARREWKIWDAIYEGLKNPNVPENVEKEDTKLVRTFKQSIADEFGDPWEVIPVMTREARVGLYRSNAYNAHQQLTDPQNKALKAKRETSAVRKEAYDKKEAVVSLYMDAGDVVNAASTEAGRTLEGLQITLQRPEMVIPEPPKMSVLEEAGRNFQGQGRVLTLTGSGDVRPLAITRAGEPVEAAEPVQALPPAPEQSHQSDRAVAKIGGYLRKAREHWAQVD